MSVITRAVNKVCALQSAEGHAQANTKTSREHQHLSGRHLSLFMFIIFFSLKEDLKKVLNRIPSLSLYK